jgi:plastocyanin
MWRRAATFCIAVWILSSVNAFAAEIDIDLSDQDGRVAESSVVSLVPVSSAPMSSHVAETATIDQRHEMFLPLAVVVRKGGRVIFTNNDVTKHQVYSFSLIKQFQFVVAQGETSSPVEFDQPGIAAIGCNIHDQMIAYVYVSDAPFAATSDSKGRTAIRDIPDGRYRLSVWHPQMAGGATPEWTKIIDIKGAHVDLAVSLPFSIEAVRGMKHMHMEY